MSDTVTEIVYLPLKPGLALSAGDKKQPWDDILGTIARQPGAKRVLWGTQIEHQDTAQMVIDWDSLESHEAFMQGPLYESFLDQLKEHFLVGEATLFHVRLPAAQMAQGDPFAGPVTECFSAFLEPGYSQEEYDARFAAFRERAARIESVNVRGLAGGWSLERQGHEALGEGVQGSLFVMFVGWDSVAEHVKFRETDDFGKLIPYLREGTVARNMWHVEFQQYK